MRFLKTHNYLTIDRKIVLKGKVATREEIVDYLKRRYKDVELTHKTRNNNFVPLFDLKCEDGSSDYIIFADGILDNDLHYTVTKLNIQDVNEKILLDNPKDMTALFLSLIEVLSLNY